MILATVSVTSAELDRLYACTESVGRDRDNLLAVVCVTLAELDRLDACTESGGRELLSAISALQHGEDTGEVIVPEWTPTHSAWLAWAYPALSAWLVEEGVVPQIDLRGADLGGTHLRGADLYGADLRLANLEGADLEGADLRWANLRGVDLGRANLEGADLEGADRSDTDSPVPGWEVVHGRMRRAS